METHTRHTRPTDWITALAALAAVVALAALIAGRPLVAAAGLLAAIAGIWAGRQSSQRAPRPMPFAQRWVLYLPRWPLTPQRLRAILAPRPGERILEVGPGVGIYSIPIARAVEPGGTFEALDVQGEMLAALTRRARAAGVNVATTQGDAQRLPFDDASFDAAYLIGVLGEIPDPAAALGELRRVLKPAGRLVIGEVLVLDPDAVRLSTLVSAARAAGFTLERRLGPRFAYFARFDRNG